MARRALGLMGGGLDSRLAFEAMRRAGYEVEGVHFETGFVREGYLPDGAENGLTVVDVKQRYLETVVDRPRHGYGNAMNPCLDCRAFFLREASSIADERGIDTLFTGDVVGQRGHDQSHRSFRVAEQDSATEGRVVRPLSAKHTDPVEGFELSRLPSSCGALQGRSRRAQLQLAREWSIESFPTPSGRCCRLADPAYGRRLRDYLDHLDRAAGERPAAEKLPLLALGRHFRLGWDLKLVISRTQAEWLELRRLGADCGIAQPLDRVGASGLIEGRPDDAQAARIAAVIAAHARLGDNQRCEVQIESDGVQRTFSIPPAQPDELEVWRI